MTKTLIIGYGNRLRSDDGIGRYFADRLEQEQWPNTATLSVHQLTPELITVIAEVDQVIFIDANGDQEEIRVQIQAVTPLAYDSVLGHRGHPGELLALTQELYGRTPLTWWVLVPARNFDWGETFSEVSLEVIPQVLEKLRELIYLSPMQNGQFCLNNA